MGVKKFLQKNFANENFAKKFFLKKIFFPVWTCIKPNLVSKIFPFTGGGGPPPEKLLRMSWNTFWFWNFWDPMISGIFQIRWFPGGGGGASVRYKRRYGWTHAIVTRQVAPLVETARLKMGRIFGQRVSNQITRISKGRSTISHLTTCLFK